MARYNGPVIDGDIHHHWKSEADVIEFLPKRWRDYVAGTTRSSNGKATGVTYMGSKISPRVSVLGGNLPHGASIRDSYPEEGPPGSDYDLMRAQLVDRFNYFRGVITFNIGMNPCVENTDFGVAISRAMHDWNASTWLSRGDDRLYSVVVPSMANPLEGAKEIRRVGSHPRIVAAMLVGNALGRPYGDPLYHPLYEAAVEMGLGLDLHPGLGPGDRAAGGPAISALTYAPSLAHHAMLHITSFIVHGVFEKYPELSVHAKEYGTAWLPHLMWQLDKNYQLLRLESPWVKKWPSEYILQHVKIGTQPLEESEDPKVYRKLISSIDGIEDMLMFDSDYPHSSADDPNYVVRRLPAEWDRKVMCDNACKHYRWDPPQADAVWERSDPAMASGA